MKRRPAFPDARVTRRSRASPRARFALAICIVAYGPAAPAARAQVVSPGPLTRAHAQLEGLRSCTRCHELRQPGASRDRCLACHTPLRDRIARGVGLHGRMAERDCGSCHKEHVGRGADIVRFDPDAFRHAETGFELRGAHAAAPCRDCHRASLLSAPDVRRYEGGSDFADRTFLGLGTRCVDCHRRDDPHDGQFGARACTDCHGEDEWAAVDRFDHGRTEYPLTGEHRRVDCEACHTREEGNDVVRFADLPAATCATCHADPHRGAMAGSCESCHSTRGWRAVDATAVGDRFDHGRTRFPLAGGHARVDCAACHGRPAPVGPTTRIRHVPGEATAAFPKPASERCTSCHVDVHDGDFAPGRRECSSCHGVDRWAPVTFGIARHAAETGFPLDGAHLALLCSSCHTVERAPAATGRPVHVRFDVPAARCADCHVDDDPHGGQFAGRSCAACHTTRSFEVAAFDHASARPGECRSCHADDDPHGAQFAERSCDACHATDAFTDARIDHDATRFPLDGAHAPLPCTRCHVPHPRPDGVSEVRYTPLPVTCAGCHGGAS